MFASMVTAPEEKTGLEGEFVVSVLWNSGCIDFGYDYFDIEAVLCGFYGNWLYISSERIREAAASCSEDSFASVKLVITP